jgi:Kef-type K+ transport system membrane component KefB
LALSFAPFTVRTLIFVAASTAALVLLPWLTPRFFRRLGNRPSELEAKFILFLLFALGGLAVWAGSEAVLPAYLAGMVLAGTVGKDHVLVRRLRTLTFGMLTPFYFIRAGAFVSVPSLLGAPLVFLILLLAKMASKLAGLFPATKAFRYRGHERVYYTLLMSTGLTFGTISALFGLSHGIIDQAQYSFLVAAVIASAVVPTMIANLFFLPRHLLPAAEPPPAAELSPPAATPAGAARRPLPDPGGPLTAHPGPAHDLGLEGGPRWHALVDTLPRAVISGPARTLAEPKSRCHIELTQP